ncbi:class I SAM-dependent methyltransferase [Actinomadura sp. DC4]|uniref:class I SAM-dependent methyltransferase n=1 Tax=Actinomadura sp. DC4 TaxID=3055069 RepID=UPI0025B0EBD9|nr:class I SAM-dependent methyltransferase [Actinomadura sp. DC4]MDN3359689.1 class I SAM-dependent methyltransferase [Actinomadura sp. DC4]
MHRRALEALEIDSRWHALELGAGLGTMSAWLAHRTGPAGHVLATDLNTRFLSQVSHPDNMTVERLDAVHDPLPESAFDLITVRALLHHLPEWRQVVKKCGHALKPGGTLVVVEPDATSGMLNVVPPHQRFWSAWCRWGRREGIDFRLGHKLPGAMHAAGLDVADTVMEVPFYHGGSAWAEFYSQTVDAAGPRLGDAIDPGLVAAFHEASADPDALMCSLGWIAVSGRRAPGACKGGAP